jgi:hypothetical protein
MPGMNPSPGHSGGADPGVSAAVRLLHRRRGWAWTLGASVLAVVAFLISGVSFWPGATGTVGAISGIIVAALLLLAVVALMVVIVDTVQLRRRYSSVRNAAIRRTSHHPVAAHPFRAPVRHQASHVAVWIAIVLFGSLTFAFLPDQVNSIAYLAGAGHSVTFTPQSYQQACGGHRGIGSGCSVVTAGTLATSPPVSAIWPSDVPLGQSFSVRQPVWNGWGAPVLMDGSQAGGLIFGIIFFDIPTLLVLCLLARMAWHGLQRRRRVPAPLITTTARVSPQPRITRHTSRAVRHNAGHGRFARRR